MSGRTVRRASVTMAGLALVGLAGCGGEGVQPLAPEAPPLEVAALDGAGVPVFGLQALENGFQRPCRAHARQAFDFWVGEWEVYNASDAFIGTNSVTSELDGCAVVEHWAGAGGGAGRSLNAFDRDTGLWYQTFMGPAFFSHLDMSGSPEADADMHLVGDRHFGSGLVIDDDWTWTAEGPDQVRQVGVTTFNNPDGTVNVNTFIGVYKRVASVTPPPTGDRFVCPNVPAALGFLVGEWQVTTGGGIPVGHASVTSPRDLCMVQERFDGPGGFEALTFRWWQPAPDGAFHMVYVDSRGERVQLGGDFEGEQLVLTGTERWLGQDREVRVTWEADGGDVVQTWATSADGMSWTDVLALRYAAS